MMGSGIEVQFFQTGMRWDHPDFKQLYQEAAAVEEDLAKALTVGQGIVDAGDTGGRTLRTQWLPNGLERASFEDEDAVTMKMIPKEKAYSTTVEQTFNLLYGGPGNGFIGELGNDGNFGIAAADDSFLRQTQNVKYAAARRDPSFVAQQVRTIVGGDPVQVSETDAMLEILGKMNRGLFYADSQANINEFNGFKRQLRAWAIAHTERQGICFDAGGQPLSEGMLRDIQKENRKNWGRIDLMLTPVDVKGDTQKLLYPKERFDPTSASDAFGRERDVFYGDWQTRLVDDPMLLPNEPLNVDGPRADGAPVTTGDSGAPAFAVTPFGSSAATTPGTRFFLDNSDGTQNASSLSTAPAMPSGRGNQANRLGVGTFYYGIAPVYDGLEGPLWVNGSPSAGTVSGATGFTTSSTNTLVRIRVDNTTPAITGLGSTYVKNRIAYRIYRCDFTPTAVSDFKYLATIGCPTSGDSYYWDNGVDMPGTYKCYGITTRKRGRAMWGFLSLLPMVKRMLPNTLTTDPFGVLLFGTPILWIPSFAMEIRNVGAYSS